MEGLHSEGIRVLPLDPNDLEPLHPSGDPYMRPRYKEGRIGVGTYASALSKLSLKTPVTPRIISRLSVARVKILWAAWFAAIADIP